MILVDQPRLERLAEVCLALPEARREAMTDQHTAFKVRSRTFAYHLVDHHGDGRVALCCKAAPGGNQALVDAEPQRFFIPAYLGLRGWVGLDPHAAPVDWDELRGLVAESYRMVAPATLARRVEAAGR